MQQVPRQAISAAILTGALERLSYDRLNSGVPAGRQFECDGPGLGDERAGMLRLGLQWIEAALDPETRVRWE